MKTLISNRKTFKVESFEQASKVYCDQRDRSGQGSSRFNFGTIRNENGEPEAHVSYNGKVWEGSDFMANNKELLFNPYSK
jgi:hypothetical protein